MTARSMSAVSRFRTPLVGTEGSGARDNASPEPPARPEVSRFQPPSAIPVPRPIPPEGRIIIRPNLLTTEDTKTAKKTRRVTAGNSLQPQKTLRKRRHAGCARHADLPDSDPVIPTHEARSSFLTAKDASRQGGLCPPVPFSTATSRLRPSIRSRPGPDRGTRNPEEGHLPQNLP